MAGLADQVIDRLRKEVWAPVSYVVNAVTIADAERIIREVVGQEETLAADETMALEAEARVDRERDNAEIVALRAQVRGLADAYLEEQHAFEAERADADALAEALREALGRAADFVSYPITWHRALAAHDKRRGGE